MALVFEDVWIVHMTIANGPGEFGEQQAVVADRNRQRIAFFWVGVGDKHIAAVMQTQTVKLCRGIGKIRAHRCAPGSAMIDREAAIEKAAAPVVAKEGRQ